MFGNTVSSRGSSSRSGNSYGRNSSMPSLRQYNNHHQLSSRTSINPLFRHSDQFTSSFDASNFDCKRMEKKSHHHHHHRQRLKRYNSNDQSSHYSSDNNNTTNIIRNGDNSTSSESTKSRYGNSDINVGECNARDFLERYSLPRVIKLDGDGEPLLLYRCFDSFTMIQAKAVYVRKGKEKIDGDSFHFPEGYAGWFSLLNEKGEKHAVAYSSILHLVREQVCSFLAVQPFTAYATQSTDSIEFDGKLAYFKTQVPGGQLFQLRAVFQHQEKPDDGIGCGRNSTRSSRISRSSRDRELSNRYAQLVSQNNQELYVPLTTKGEFYETHTSLKSRLCFPGMLDKTGPLALDKDCLYKISHLLRRVPLPVKVKLLHGTLPEKTSNSTDTFILEKKIREPLLVTCTLPPPWSTDLKHELGCFSMNSNAKLTKFDFGYDSENKLFKSQRIQSALVFCQKNLENWYKEVKLVPKIVEKTETKSIEKDFEIEIICPNCRKDVQCECSRNRETRELKPKKWYQHLKILKPTFLNDDSMTSSKFDEIKDPMDGMEKRKSIDRYKDMSKLIEEKLGRKGYNPVKKSASFMFTKKLFNETTTESSNPALLKCQSLDSQLYPLTEELNNEEKCGTSKSNLSYEFQMCILDNNDDKLGIDIVRKNASNHVTTRVDIEQNKDGLIKKTKPDLIPTLPKNDVGNSIITQRLYKEFHVKTKIQNKKKNEMKQQQQRGESNKVVSRVLLNVDEIPYGHVKDEVCNSPNGGKITENIYAEICENENTIMCNNCDKKNNDRTKNSTTTQYCYVKLGSNGDSVTQSDSDEAIYNTLR